MRYYDLDATGKVKGSYAVPQPDKMLHLVEDAPDKESRRDGVPGSAWVPDTDIIDARLARETDQAQIEADQAEIMPDLATMIAKAEDAISIPAIKQVMIDHAKMIYQMRTGKVT